MINLKKLLDLSRPDTRGYDPVKIPLTPGFIGDKIKKQLADLEAEWEQLDSYGSGYARQMQIQKEIARLWREKERWDKMYAAVKPFPVSENGKSSNDDCVLLGANWADGKISYVVSHDSYGRHPASMIRADNRWRFVPEINYLAWWVKPSEEEKELVANYLSDKGYEVKHNGALGYINENYIDGDPNAVIFGGLWSTGRIIAHDGNDPKGAGAGHTREMGSNRWTYYQSMKTVFWKHLPDNDDKFAVENWLTKRGYAVESHRKSDEYWAIAIAMDNEKKRKNLKENKKLLMEANQDEAALDFLKQMVRKGPFKGKVYLAGGAVRDMIRGETPKDLDVVVTDNGKEGGMKFATWLAQQMGNYKEGSNPVLFPNFGTAKVVLQGIHNGVSLDGFDVEAVFARKEIYTPGSRKPEVFPGTIEDDAFRRDFTVNSMMLDLTTDQILDITGHGKTDIAAGLIRTTSNPDEIFGQDALRMFRAIRFATKYKWKIDPATWNGIKKNLDNLSNTSKERMRDELDKILLTKDPTYGIRLLRDSGLLPHIAPELQQAVGMTQNKHHKDDVFDHTMEVLNNTKPELVQRLMALFHDIGKVATREETPTGVHFIGHENVGADIVDRIMRDLKYPLELINAVKMGVHQHMRLKHGKDDATMSDSTLRKFKIALGDNLENVLDVIHADNISHADASSMPNQIARVRERLKTLDVQVKKPNLPINGMDLQAIGVKPGPIMGKILGAITDAWYENPNLTREAAIAIAQSML